MLELRQSMRLIHIVQNSKYRQKQKLLTSIDPEEAKWEGVTLSKPAIPVPTTVFPLQKEHRSLKIWLQAIGICYGAVQVQTSHTKIWMTSITVPNPFREQHPAFEGRSFLPRGAASASRGGFRASDSHIVT